MKPHLYRIKNIWWCRYNGQLQNGYTPKSAYIRLMNNLFDYVEEPA